MDFEKHIKELLLIHDCVILPGLGGFVANYKPAALDPVRNSISPPSKHILFNSNLVHNDGLLYAHVSKFTGQGYKEVEVLAQSYIDRIRKNVIRGMKHSIEGLGYFFRDNEDQIQFSEESGNNYLLESYGLPHLNYREFEKLPKPETYRAVSVEFDPEARKKRIRRWMYGTAAAVLVSAMVFIPLKTGYFNQAGIDLPAADSFRKEQMVNPDSEEAAISSASLAPASKSFLPDPEYNIVVGSFRDFGNAREFRNQVITKGHESRILGIEKGYFRVTAGTFNRKDEAVDQLISVFEDYDNAWVLSI